MPSRLPGGKHLEARKPGAQPQAESIEMLSSLGVLVATLPDAWGKAVCAGAGWPGVNIL